MSQISNYSYSIFSLTAVRAVTTLIGFSHRDQPYFWTSPTHPAHGPRSSLQVQPWANFSPCLSFVVGLLVSRTATALPVPDLEPHWFGHWPWTCLVITDLPHHHWTLSNPVTPTRPNLDLWIGFLAWPCTCFLITSLPDDLHSWLNLALVCSAHLIWVWWN